MFTQNIFGVGYNTQFSWSVHTMKYIKFEFSDRASKKLYLGGNRAVITIRGAQWLPNNFMCLEQNKQISLQNINKEYTRTFSYYTSG